MGVYVLDRLRLPGRRNTDIVIAVVVVPVVDIETLGIKVTDVDTVTVRIKILLAPIYVIRD